MWLIIASILATFNVGKAKDSEGKEIPIDDEYLDPSGFIQCVLNSFLGTAMLKHPYRHKAPFKCSITPRFDGVKDILTQ